MKWTPYTKEKQSKQNDYTNPRFLEEKPYAICQFLLIVVYENYLIIIIIMEAFIKRRIPGKTTCSKALQYNSNKVVIKLKLY